jgi:hypothetical protein
MKSTPEFDTFNAAMDAILRADPVAVRAEMEREQRERAKERKARGERKRGKKKAAKKRPSTSARVSSDKGV